MKREERRIGRKEWKEGNKLKGVKRKLEWEGEEETTRGGNEGEEGQIGEEKKDRSEGRKYGSKNEYFQCRLFATEHQSIQPQPKPTTRVCLCS